MYIWKAFPCLERVSTRNLRDEAWIEKATALLVTSSKKHKRFGNSLLCLEALGYFCTLWNNLWNVVKQHSNDTPSFTAASKLYHNLWSDSMSLFFDQKRCAHHRIAVCALILPSTEARPRANPLAYALRELLSISIGLLRTEDILPTEFTAALDCGLVYVNKSCQVSSCKSNICKPV